ncbi:MAG: TusE/DsrC/DsvC family sulfur relay protein [Nitrospirota bacterium]
MPAIEIEGKSIELDDEGYLTNPDDWNEKVACALAEMEKVHGVCPLTEQTMEVFKFLREYYKKYNAFPYARAVCTNVHNKECTMERFPDASIAWKIAGLPKPPPEVLAVFSMCGGA